MRIHYIIPTLNSAAFVNEFKSKWIREINSLSQKRDDYITFTFIDGGSSDGTKALLLDTPVIPNSTLLDMPGSTIYEAWNRGLDTIIPTSSSNDWIAFIGLDDHPKDLSILLKVILYVENNILLISFTNNIKLTNDFFSFKKLIKGQKFVHAGSLHRAKLFANDCRFLTDYKIIGDYEFMLRMKLVNHVHIEYQLPYYIGLGGISYKFHTIRENFKLRKKYGLGLFAKYLFFKETLSYLKSKIISKYNHHK